MKYSLWKLYHESAHLVMAYKVKDTNSTKEIDEHMAQCWMNAASFFREEEELNAEYLQTFEAE
jgi:hypothetical protein